MASRSAEYLGEEVDGVLANLVQAAGKNCPGKLRKDLVESIDKTRGLLLCKGLENHENQEARPVWCWPERDKMSSQWALCIPGPRTAMSNSEFGEVMAAHLLMPSPICLPHLGDMIRDRRRVDLFGDEVMSATLSGDGWRRRHDEFKLRLLELFRWAGKSVQGEVFNLFSKDIPQAGLSQIERGQKRQGLVPDFRVQGGPGEGAVLADLKFLSCNTTRYPRNPRPQLRAVDRRAAGLTAEYARKAKSVDMEFCGVPRGEQGPVLRHLQSYGEVRGFVVGRWGEMSSHLHDIISDLAKTRQRLESLLPGGQERDRIGNRYSESGHLALLTGSLRRQLSLLAVRSQARLLIDRVEGLIGVGAISAARRRAAALRTARELELERRAHYVGQKQGRNIVRRGCFKLN